MPNVAANNYPVIFGDLSGYTMVNRVGFSIQVLRELYAELGQVAVVGRIRFGGQVLEPWRLRL
jgi:HK97 family phage major capsid protein